MTRNLLLAAALVAAGLATAVPAQASSVCVTVYRPNNQSTSVCGPYGRPLPPLGCPVYSTVADVCTS